MIRDLQAALDDRVDVDVGGLDISSPRQRLQVTDDRRHALRAVTHLRDELGHPRDIRASARELALEHGEVERHVRQRVVDLVTDAGGQPAERDQSLRRDEPLVESLAFGDVDTDADDPRRPPAGIARRDLAAAEDPHPASVGGALAIFDAEPRRAPGQAILQRALRAREVIAVDDRQPPVPAARRGRLGVAEALEPAVVERDDTLLDVGIPARDARADHRVFEGAALGQVFDDGDRALERAVVGAHGDAEQSHGQDRAVLAAHLVFDVAAPGREELGQHDLARITRARLGEKIYRRPTDHLRVRVAELRQPQVAHLGDEALAIDAVQHHRCDAQHRTPL